MGIIIRLPKTIWIVNLPLINLIESMRVILVPRVGINYIYTQEGRLYLAVVIDLFP